MFLLVRVLSVGEAACMNVFECGNFKEGAEALGLWVGHRKMFHGDACHDVSQIFDTSNKGKAGRRAELWVGCAEYRWCGKK